MLGQAGLEVLHCFHAVAQAELGPRIEASPAAQPGAAQTQRRTTHFARLLPVQDTKQPRHLEEQSAITGDGSGAWRCRTLLHRRHGHPPRPRERTKSCKRGCGRSGCKTRQCERASQAQDANAPDPSIGFLAQLRDCCDLVPPFRRSTRRCRGTKRGAGKSTRHTSNCSHACHSRRVVELSDPRRTASMKAPARTQTIGATKEKSSRCGSRWRSACKVSRVSRETR